MAAAQLSLAHRPEMLANARRSRTEAAEAAFRRGGARAPAPSLAWAQLAYASSLLGKTADVNLALALSVLTGPNHVKVVAFRSALAVNNWSHLDQRTRALYRPQIVRAMLVSAQRFIEGIRRGDNLDVVRASLRGEPGLEARFERMLQIMGRD
jgi:hypothetical protein